MGYIFNFTALNKCREVSEGVDETGSTTSVAILHTALHSRPLNQPIRVKYCQHKSSVLFISIFNVIQQTTFTNCFVTNHMHFFDIPFVWDPMVHITS
ncbi:hypothetical protein DICVIV_08690 [Dictyocaulus viviparus]|uniref:Uncharacterized protein n=1 Tax=Dictyocaulus viviparus TaxID=29172 RepID=A0A0D8XNB5_DICVI|nr:hypothetical protein DICVIV_08690 [Dictyocaulus viviparus]